VIAFKLQGMSIIWGFEKVYPTFKKQPGRMNEGRLESFSKPRYPQTNNTYDSEKHLVFSCPFCSGFLFAQPSRHHPIK
jgi:hypothetical protein